MTASEPDRWWLVWSSIVLQQLFLVQLLHFTTALHAPRGAVVVIWLMSLSLPLAYVRPLTGKNYFRSCAKLGWWYALAALVASLSGVFFVAFQHGDLFGVSIR